MPSGRSPPPGFGIITRRTGWALIRLGPQFRLDAVQPALQPCRLDRRAGHAIDARRTLVGAHQVVRMAQDVRTVDLVVEQVEPVVRLRLRLEIELPLKRPDRYPVLSGSSPITNPRLRRKHTRSEGPSLRWRYPVSAVHDLSDPAGPSSETMSEARPPSHTGLPRYPVRPSDMPCPLPRWTETGASVGCFPAPPGLPRYSGGSASMTSLSRPAQALLTLRPADCSTAQGGLCHEASARPVTRPSRSSATRVYRPFPGWDPPPLVNAPFGDARRTRG